MEITIDKLDDEQKKLLAKIGLLFLDMGGDLKNAGDRGSLLKTDIWAIRTTMDVLDELFDEMSEDNQALFEFLQDGTPPKKLQKA